MINFLLKFFTVFQASISSNNLSDNPNSGNIAVTLTTSLPNPEVNSTTKNNQTLVLETDANILKLINLIILKPIQNFLFKKFHPTLSGPIVLAHYQYDSETGEYFSFVSNTGPSLEFSIFFIKTDEKLENLLQLFLLLFHQN
ncbi:hypothetical protein C2G38_2164691 [Gigaspora rosea]|uniref:Uncharacterized protein n=1 Tax=Gigaspora rosea TaxID=44941 RepID=A0A397W0Y2_9GLOM|nr:hypothetical protein C2G38_2164691 [Gigaspora rosea]